MNLNHRLLSALQHAPHTLDDLALVDYLAEHADVTRAKAREWHDEWLASQEAQGDIEPEYYMGHEIDTNPLTYSENFGDEQRWAYVGPDPINPSHYQQGDIECIDAIRSALGDEQFKGFLKGNLMKYVWRSEHKGCPVENIEKAEWYLKRLLSELRLEKECE